MDTRPFSPNGLGYEANTALSRVISTVFFNGALIRTLGTGADLTPVANNARGHLLAKITLRLYVYVYV